MHVITNLLLQKEIDLKEHQKYIYFKFTPLIISFFKFAGKWFVD